MDTEAQEFITSRLEPLRARRDEIANAIKVLNESLRPLLTEQQQIEAEIAVWEHTLRHVGNPEMYARLP